MNTGQWNRMEDNFLASYYMFTYTEKNIAWRVDIYAIVNAFYIMKDRRA